MNQYKTILQPASETIIEKKSRFIGRIFPVETEAEMNEILTSIRVQNHDANHNCYAYVIGERGENVGFSDDGEPSGTAGKPILAVINGMGLTNVLIIVTRFFGGTLLGTGGLVRAYGEGAKVCALAAQTVTKQYGVQVSVRIEYPDLQKLQYALEQQKFRVLQTEFTDKVVLLVEVAKEAQESLEKMVETITSGQGQVEFLRNTWITIVEE